MKNSAVNRRTFLIRMDPNLFSKLEGEAKKQRRKINAQIELIVEEWFEKLAAK